MERTTLGRRAFTLEAALAIGGALRLNIRGTANHPHIVDLSAEEIAAIARNERVAKESSEEKGHTHHILFN